MMPMYVPPLALILPPLMAPANCKSAVLALLVGDPVRLSAVVLEVPLISPPKVPAPLSVKKPVCWLPGDN